MVDTGEKQIVYVERKPGMFEGVEVQLGPRNGEYYPVIKGLAAGERVAAAGAFLVDAETRLNPAAAADLLRRQRRTALASNRTVRPAAAPWARVPLLACPAVPRNLAGRHCWASQQRHAAGGPLPTGQPIFVERKLGQPR